MNLKTAALVFPVLGISPGEDQAFGAVGPDVLCRPHQDMLRWDILRGSELIDATGRRFKVRRVSDTGAAAPRSKNFFGRYRQVSLSLEAMGEVSLDDLKGRFCRMIRARPDEWCAKPEHVAEDLASLENAQSVSDLINLLDTGDFLGTPASGNAPRPRPPKSAARQILAESATGPAVTTAGAQLAYPILVVSLNPRRLTLVTSSETFGRLYGSRIRKRVLEGAEIIDSKFHRFRIARVLDLGTEWPWGIWHLATVVRNMSHKVDYELEPLVSTSLEAARAKIAAYFNSDRSGMSSTFDKAYHAQCLKRIQSADGIRALGDWPLAGEVFGLSGAEARLRAE